MNKYLNASLSTSFIHSFNLSFDFTNLDSSLFTFNIPDDLTLHNYSSPSQNKLPNKFNQLSVFVFFYLQVLLKNNLITKNQIPAFLHSIHAFHSSSFQTLISYFFDNFDNINSSYQNLYSNISKKTSKTNKKNNNTTDSDNDLISNLVLLANSNPISTSLNNNDIVYHDSSVIDTDIHPDHDLNLIASKNNTIKTTKKPRNKKNAETTTETTTETLGENNTKKTIVKKPRTKKNAEPVLLNNVETNLLSDTKNIINTSQITSETLGENNDIINDTVIDNNIVETTQHVDENKNKKIVKKPRTKKIVNNAETLIENNTENNVQTTTETETNVESDNIKKTVKKPRIKKIINTENTSETISHNTTDNINIENISQNTSDNIIADIVLENNNTIENTIENKNDNIIVDNTKIKKPRIKKNNIISSDNITENNIQEDTKIKTKKPRIKKNIITENTSHNTTTTNHDIEIEVRDIHFPESNISFLIDDLNNLYNPSDLSLIATFHPHNHTFSYI